MNSFRIKRAKTKLKGFVIESGETLNSGQQFVEHLSYRLELVKAVGECDIILGVCPIISRVGTEIEAAMKVFEDKCAATTKPFILLMLHHTLDRDYVVPDCSRYVGDCMSLTVHALFHEDHGLLKNCDVNTQAIHQTLEKLKEFRKENMKKDDQKQDKSSKMKLKMKKDKNKDEKPPKMKIAQSPSNSETTKPVSRVIPPDFSREDSVYAVYGSASVPQLVSVESFRQLSMAVSTQGSGVGTTEDSRGAAGDGEAKREMLTVGQEKPYVRETGSKVIPPDFSRGDSAYGSASASQLVSVESFRQLSIAVSTQGSGVGTTEDSRGAAGDGEAKSKKLNPGQHKSSLNKTGIEAEDQFEDISTITYNIMECIGRGGFGTVYKGSYLGTQAAVKIIKQDPRTEDRKIANEFRIPSRLSHPNIVQMMAVAKSETEILIANAYIHGADLDDVLHGDGPVKLQEEDKLSVALDISKAVEYIHWKGIIHQDLKPANIMVAADNGKAYLTDWGLANLIEAVTNSKLVGTPMYVARECLVECEKSTTMSDMWSLGITFLEMFTDSKPWLYRTLQELRKLLKQKSTPHAMSKLQSAHQDIVLPLLEYDPESRMKVKDLVALLKTKVDLSKKCGSGY
ncbi:interferon-induced, double-stranded RNA-activated protein kinase-like [Engraulis encrasicolus]|uniref:interferon-induced, double-stranded RNA-activated protein kinase-like n=1 Tax=Engraulis encrasicolus TaxID=184585 RepID=UPI002FD52E38